MLEDTSITYTEITEWLNDRLRKLGMGTISRTAVGQYALHIKKVSARFLETQEQVRELVRLAKEKSEEDIAEGALQLSIYKLTERIAMADSEIEGMSVGKAIELAAKISRAKAHKDKAYAQLKSEYEKGFEKFLKLIYLEIEADPDLLQRIEALAQQTLGKIKPK